MNVQNKKESHIIHSEIPFSVPDGYFDTLNERIITAVKVSGQEPKSMKSSLWRRIAIASASVAAVAIMLIVGGLMIYDTRRSIDSEIENIMAMDDNRVDAMIELLDGYQLNDVLADAMLWEY